MGPTRSNRLEVSYPLPRTMQQCHGLGHVCAGMNLELDEPNTLDRFVSGVLDSCNVEATAIRTETGPRYAKESTLTLVRRE